MPASVLQQNDATPDTYEDMYEKNDESEHYEDESCSDLSIMPASVALY